MLNRRHIRIKVLQALYAAIQSESLDVFEGQRQLVQKLDKIYDLTIYQMSVLLEIHSFAKQRLEDNKKKHYPTEEDKNPNTRFIDNAFLLQLGKNKDLLVKADRLAINWVNETELIRNIYDAIINSDIYKKYMQEDEVQYKNDKDLVISVFQNIILPNESLHSLFAEKNLHWADDYNLASELVFLIISAFKISWEENHLLPPLYKDESKTSGRSQDKEFAKDLFKLTLENNEKYDEFIIPNIKNWEIDRLATIDKILIKMALSEVLEMPTIPIKVSMNEYIELSKYFSTQKSKVFINGLLDKIIAQLKEAGQIKKQGRGLVN
ncbi:MAG: transcription antitermination factor NusB [Bacteroidetes bacterium 4572_77]|nr:MAG: transcription antitermination factor NusB [Bacteroidetes bacterium 4572_77]